MKSPKYYKNAYYTTNELTPGRPTLVFIHGLSGSSSAWFRYQAELEDKYNILTYDLRGHGKSIKSKEFQDYLIENLAQDLYALISYLKIKDFILISHSFGTMIALEFLAKHQSLVKAAIFLSPNFNSEKRKGAKLLKLLLKYTKALSWLPFFAKIGKSIDYSEYENTGDWNLRRMRADIFNTSWRIYFYCLRQSFEFNGENFLSEVAVTTLVIHGEKDTVVPVKNAIAWSKKIKNLQLVLLKKADHMLVLNNCSDITPIIENFIKIH